MKLISRFRQLVVSVVVALGLAACGSGGGGDDSPSAPAVSGSAAGPQSLVDAAKSEGSLTFYTSLNAAILDPVIAAFKKQFGIDVEVVRLLADALPARFQTEQSSGIHKADLISSSGQTSYNLYAAKSYTSPLDTTTMPALAGEDAKYLHGNRYATISLQPLGVMYNTDAVDKSDLTSWTSLLDSKFKGKIALPDPSQVSSYIGLFEILDKSPGNGFLGKLGGQRLNVVSAQPAAAQLVASGEDAISFPIVPSVALPLKDSGAPVDITYFAPTAGVELFAALASKSSHPNAAKLFLNFMLTNQGQQLLNKETAASPLTAPVPKTLPLPKGYQTIDQAATDPGKAKVLSELRLS